MNVLFIMADQLRWDHLSCAGHPHLSTPHIDALAAHYAPRPPVRLVAREALPAHAATGIVAVLAFNVLGDGLRDALDPRLNR